MPLLLSRAVCIKVRIIMAERANTRLDSQRHDDLCGPSQVFPLSAVWSRSQFVFSSLVTVLATGTFHLLFLFGSMSNDTWCFESLSFNLTLNIFFFLTHWLVSSFCTRTFVESHVGHSYAIAAFLLTYLCPSLPVEHRPSTTPRHRTLFWAALVIPDQLVPCCFSSASVSRLQLLRGRPLFLFPCGFQVRAWRVVLDAGFLRVCPIQPHFLRSICLATGSCPARSHSSSFRTFSCHWIL